MIWGATNWPQFLLVPSYLFQSQPIDARRISSGEQRNSLQRTSKSLEESTKKLLLLEKSMENLSMKELLEKSTEESLDLSTEESLDQSTEE